MEELQREVADIAVFDDALEPNPGELHLEQPLEIPTGQATGTEDVEGPVVVGIDQAFTEDQAVSVAVAIRDGSVVDIVAGRESLEIPYIPGLLAFREAGAIVDALERLSIEPDLLVLDGSGRLHYREAGIATHVGVLFEVPAVGVAKSILCGRPERSLDDPLPAGARVPILADATVETEPGTVIGHAYQSRQFAQPANRYVNPLIVSPGHRVGADTTVDVVDAQSAGYKLPEPTRLADRAVDRCVTGDLPACDESSERWGESSSGNGCKD